MKRPLSSRLEATGKIRKSFFSLSGTALSDSAYCVSPYVCMSVYVSVTLVHPAKAIGWNVMPFGRDIRVVPRNIVLDGGSEPHGKESFMGSEPPVKLCVVNCGQTVTDSRMVTIDSL